MRENEVQLFLYLSQDIPARCAVEVIRKECIDEGSGSLTLVPIHSEVKVGCCSHARSAQAEEEVSVVILRRKLWRTAAAGVCRVKRRSNT